MRESSFIEQNKNKWVEFEEALKTNTKDPEKVGELFIGITDDLSYARTFYPNRSVRVYLNNLSQRVFHQLYKKRTDGRSRFWGFWRKDLPAVMFSARFELLISFFAMMLTLWIGWISSAYGGASVSNGYKEAFMDYYSDNAEIDFFLMVTFNNVQVAFLTFVTGVFFGLGALCVIMYNGVSLGMALNWLHQLDYLGEASLSLWLHGTIEISAIVIAGAAGLVMGRGLAIPGSYPRFTSFLHGARRGMTIMIAAVPLFVLAGFIEGFLTRHREVPDAIRLAIIFASLMFILFFFVVYPFLRHRSGLKLRPPDPVRTSSTQMSYTGIVGLGEVVKQTFVMITKSIKVMLPLVLLSGAAWVSVLFLTSFKTVVYDYTSALGWGTSIEITIRKVWWSLHNTGTLFQSGGQLVMIVGTALILALILFLTLYHVSRKAPGAQPSGASALMPALLFGGVTTAPLFIVWPLGLIISFVVLPVAAVVATSFVLRAVGQPWGYKILGNRFGRLLLSTTFHALLAMILFVLINTPLTFVLDGVLEWFIDVPGYQQEEYHIAIVTVLAVLSVSIGYALLVVGSVLQYFSLREIQWAPDLKARIRAFGRLTEGA